MTDWLHVNEDKASLRRRLAAAFVESATDFGGPGQIAANLDTLLDAAIATIEAAPLADRYGLLLERIQAEGGMWTGARAANAIFDIEHRSVTSERGVQVMRRLVERGQLVIANPPRGQTFTLPFGPGGDVGYEWATAEEGATAADLKVVTRTRTKQPWRTAPWKRLLRREVKFGPWVEVPVEGGDDD